jgi:DNA-binding NtrC family response regulator
MGKDLWPFFFARFSRDRRSNGLFTSSKKKPNANGDGTVTKRAAEKLSILVVDDEPAVRDALKLVLDASGYVVSLAETGRAGISQARGRDFHVAIVDLDLPDTSGLEVIRTMRELQPGIVSILITAQVTAEALIQAQNLEVIEILSKPFRPEDILQLISKGRL